MSNNITDMSAQGYGFIVENRQSGSISIIIPDNFPTKDSRQRAISYINKHIILKKCEKFGNEDFTDFAIRLSELAEEQYPNKKNSRFKKN